MEDLRGESLLGKRKKGQRRRGSPLTISGEWGSSGLMLPADEPRAEATGFSEQEVIEDVQEKKFCQGRSQTAEASGHPSQPWPCLAVASGDLKPKEFLISSPRCTELGFPGKRPEQLSLFQKFQATQGIWR